MATTLEHSKSLAEIDKGENGPYASYLPTAYRSLEASTQAVIHRREAEELTATQIVHEPFDPEVVRDIMSNTAGFAFELSLTQEELDKLTDELFGAIPEGAVMSVRNQQVLVRRAFIKLDPEKTRSAQAVLAYADEPSGNSPLDYTVGDYFVDTTTTNLERELEKLMHEAIAEDPRLLQPSGFHVRKPNGETAFDAMLYEKFETLQVAAGEIISAGRTLGLSKAKTKAAYDRVKAKLQDELTSVQAQ
jgi:hypothetical protein